MHEVHVGHCMAGAHIRPHVHTAAVDQYMSFWKLHTCPLHVDSCGTCATAIASAMEFTVPPYCIPSTTQTHGPRAL